MRTPWVIRLLLFWLTVVLIPPVWGAPDTTMTITPTATSGTTITASDENTRMNNISTPYNAHSHTAIASTTANTYTIGNAAAGAKSLAISNSFTTSPSLRYSDTAEAWQASNDASTFLNVLGQNKVGTFTRDLSVATGTQAITGVGFKPTSIIIFGSVTGQVGVTPSWGMTDCTTYRSVSMGSGGTASNLTNAAQLIDIETSVSGATGTATLSTCDADGFTLSWTKNGSPTGTATMGYAASR